MCCDATIRAAHGECCRFADRARAVVHGRQGDVTLGGLT